MEGKVYPDGGDFSSLAALAERQSVFALSTALHNAHEYIAVLRAQREENRKTIAGLNGTCSRYEGVTIPRLKQENKTLRGKVDELMASRKTDLVADTPLASVAGRKVSGARRAAGQAVIDGIAAGALGRRTCECEKGQSWIVVDRNCGGTHGGALDGHTVLGWIQESDRKTAALEEKLGSARGELTRQRGEIDGLQAENEQIREILAANGLPVPRGGPGRWSFQDLLDQGRGWDE